MSIKLLKDLLWQEREFKSSKMSSSKEMGFLNPIFPFFSEGEGAV